MCDRQASIHNKPGDGDTALVITVNCVLWVSASVPCPRPLVPGILARPQPAVCSETQGESLDRAGPGQSHPAQSSGSVYKEKTEISRKRNSRSALTTTISMILK